MKNLSVRQSEVVWDLTDYTANLLSFCEKLRGIVTLLTVVVSYSAIPCCCYMNF